MPSLSLTKTYQKYPAKKEAEVGKKREEKQHKMRGQEEGSIFRVVRTGGPTNGKEIFIPVVPIRLHLVKVLKYR